jgi:hypothetical protein
VFENRALTKIFGRKGEEVTGEWRRLQNEELCVIKSRRMGWVGNVACMGEGEEHIGFWCGDLMVRVHLEDLGVQGRIILKWIFKK